MIERERITFEKYLAEGYDVIKAGAPDLMLLKDRKISFIEVKSKKDKLSPNQERAFALLEKHGFNTKVEIVEFLPERNIRLPLVYDNVPWEDKTDAIAYVDMPVSEMLKYRNYEDFVKRRPRKPIKERLGR